MAASDNGASTAPPAWLSYAPEELRFGTSGLRGRVTAMTDLEVYINARGFLGYLVDCGDAAPPDAVAVAQDLRAVDPTSGLESSPRIARAVCRAVQDAGFELVDYGQVPTPALAYQAGRTDERAGKSSMPCIMVTGSHIPADRNGVKFYKKAGEVLKSDETGILATVQQVRALEYGRSAAESRFDEHGMLATKAEPAVVDESAEQAFGDRYARLFAARRPLAGARIVVYQHSAVGRDLLMRILVALGAEAIPVDRSDTFVPVDTEDVSAEDEARYRRYALAHRPEAVVSTDGDSDRPLVVDERGRFDRRDSLGIVTAEFLGARFAAVPITTTDALDRHVERCRAEGRPTLEIEKTRIGSPHVIQAMQDAVARGVCGVVGWEANGGFLTATDFEVGAGTLSALPTRDAVLPILAVLLQAAEREVPVSQLFDELPSRATRAGLLDAFPSAASQAMLAALRPTDGQLLAARFDGDVIHGERAAPTGREARTLSGAQADELLRRRERLERIFSAEHGFGAITGLDFLDGIRMFFSGGDVAHLRPSGNAPQLRIYAVSDAQQRADEIVHRAIEEPDGLLRQLERQLAGEWAD